MRQPGQPPPRPIAGPILPLVASSVGTDQLLGGAGGRPAAVDALAARTLVKGEALSPPAGRADDYVWPRREVGREQAKEPPKEPARNRASPIHLSLRPRLAKQARRRLPTAPDAAEAKAGDRADDAGPAAAAIGSRADQLANFSAWVHPSSSNRSRRRAEASAEPAAAGRPLGRRAGSAGALSRIQSPKLI